MGPIALCSSEPDTKGQLAALVATLGAHLKDTKREECLSGLRADPEKRKFDSGTRKMESIAAIYPH